MLFFFIADHHVPCRLALAIMVLHSSRSGVIDRSADGFCDLIQIDRPSRSFSLGLPLLLVPFNFPVVTRFSSCFCRITWPINFACRFLIAVISRLVSFASFRTLSLVFLAVHDILIILLRNHISTASKRLCVCLLMVHVSHPYNTIGSM